MKTFKTVTCYFMATLYILAGVNHFVNPDFYVSIMPPYLPWHLELVYLSGVAEIVCGVVLYIPRTRVLGAWLTIALLIAVFPANIHTAVNPELFDTIPRWSHYVRLPIQGLLVLWAYWYTRPGLREPRMDTNTHE
jgi:uncharacterized membrane protein